MRGLTKSEMSELEYIKLCILSNLDPSLDITAERVYDALENNLPINPNVFKTVSVLNDTFKNDIGRDPTIEELRNIHASACVVCLSGV